MKTTLYKASDRGSADYGWLKASYYFSFAQYYNPKQVHFGLLRVLNDDTVEGGGGFPTHPHDNMEIITIPHSGAIQHKDSTGGNGVVKAGDVQVMSAGSGVRHSEFNASATEALNLFQIWIFPKLANIPPRYDQRTFDVNDRINKWQTVVSGDKDSGALWINQDAQLSLTKLEAGKTLQYNNAYKGNGVFLVNINGTVNVNGTALNRRDAIGISETENFSIEATEDSELLAIEIPMN